MIDAVKRLEDLRETVKNNHPDYTEKEITAHITGMLQGIEHGQWLCINEYENVYMCSNCGGEVSYDVGSPKEFDYKYCMYCGAVMDE